MQNPGSASIFLYLFCRLWWEPQHYPLASSIPISFPAYNSVTSSLHTQLKNTDHVKDRSITKRSRLHSKLFHFLLPCLFKNTHFIYFLTQLLYKEISLATHRGRHPHSRGLYYQRLCRAIARQKGSRWIPRKLNTFILKNTSSQSGFKGT